MSQQPLGLYFIGGMATSETRDSGGCFKSTGSKLCMRQLDESGDAMIGGTLNWRDGPQTTIK